ncbi:cytochrome P450 [Phyllobacterium zundukense]|uniref:Cytochrome P450 n=1 Tax=Phyllobacterium zundukense TaxID=1867719 RepID=A0ACD4CYN1_9HYPH|nr:cytochrome P450 [Phyllobacterium zundukense]UXN58563.1 cytochrome P450 [Phyllobacterium zundukense]
MAKSHYFDIVSPEFHANRFPTLDRMRAEGPVVRIQLPIVGQTWLAVTHGSCAMLMKDLRATLTQARIVRVLPRTISLLALNMMGHDDPQHRRTCVASLSQRSSARR